MKILDRSITQSLFTISFLSLCMPSFFAAEFGGGFIFGHYIALTLYGFMAVIQSPSSVKLVFPSILFIVASSALNATDFSPSVAIFHCINLVWISLLAKEDPYYVADVAMVALKIIIGLVMILAVMRVLGLQSLMPSGAFIEDRHTGQIRLTAFATEPAASGLIIMLLSRYLMAARPDLYTARLLVASLLATIALLSLIAAIAALLIVANYLFLRGNVRRVMVALVGVVFLALGLGTMDFFTIRLSNIDQSQGLMGLNSGTIRLLPYFYLSDVLPENPFVLIWGGGAGSFQRIFFNGLGQYYTVHDTLTGQMAGVIYDYGIPAVATFFLWNRPEKINEKVLYLMMTVFFMLNTSIGTYLFVLFGGLSLLENKVRRVGDYKNRQIFRTPEVCE